MKTIRRDRLMALAKAGKLIMVSSYHYDEMSGTEQGEKEMPVRISGGHGDFVEGQCNLRESDFRSSVGYASINEDGTINLGVHSNCFYTFRLANGATIQGNKKANRAQRPENQRMQLGASPSESWVWRLSNGKYVHPSCREDYQRKCERGGSRPSIDAAVYQGYAMSRFTLCEHCQIPIWDPVPRK